MAESATVTSTVQTAHHGDVTTTDTVNDTTNANLSGEANKNGTSTHSEIPNNEGGTTTTEKSKPLPDSAEFLKAKISISRNCGGDREGYINLDGEGNVSATARLEGNCIVVTEVNKKLENGATVITTNTKKKCCQ